MVGVVACRQLKMEGMPQGVQAVLVTEHISLSYHRKQFIELCLTRAVSHAAIQAPWLICEVSMSGLGRISTPYLNPNIPYKNRIVSANIVTVSLSVPHTS